MTTKVELLRRTGFGEAGDVVEVDDETLEAYGADVMKATKKPLTAKDEVDPTATAPEITVDPKKLKELEAKEKELNDRATELDTRNTALDAKEADIVIREQAVEAKEKELAGTGDITNTAITDAKNTAMSQKK